METTATILEIIDILNEDDGAMIPRPASEDDIAECNMALNELVLPALPADYIEFLKINNGLAWNGIEFYGTDNVSEADKPSGFLLIDIVTKSDDFDERYYDAIETDCLHIGRADEELYTYNADKKTYEIRDLSAICEIYDEYETFADLFVAEVGTRLGLFSDVEECDDDGRYDAYD